MPSSGRHNYFRSPSGRASCDWPPTETESLCVCEVDFRLRRPARQRQRRVAGWSYDEPYTASSHRTWVVMLHWQMNRSLADKRTTGALWRRLRTTRLSHDRIMRHCRIVQSEHLQKTHGHDRLKTCHVTTNNWTSYLLPWPRLAVSVM